jgi:hypothetical protein
VAKKKAQDLVEGDRVDTGHDEGRPLRVVKKLRTRPDTSGRGRQAGTVVIVEDSEGFEVAVRLPPGKDLEVS